MHRVIKFNHGTIIREEITCKRILLWKSIEFCIPLKNSATRYKEKTEKFLVTRPPTCWKFHLFFDFYERTKKEWKQIYRNYSDGYIHVFFIDHSRHKTVNETTCRTPSANACQLCSYELKSFPTAMTIFWGYQNFLIFLTKYFWPLLNSPYLIFQLPFCKISVNKTV